MAANEEEEGLSRQLQLSDLPDEILIRILSMLPTTQDAVRTCLLLFMTSEHQQHLWKSLTRLEFRGKRWFRKGNDQLLNFVEKVMHLRDHSVPLESFSLKCYMKRDDSDRIQKWITKAAQSNVEHLTLYNFDDEYHYDDDDDDDYDDYDDGDYSYYKMRILPFCRLECQSLVKLDLEYIQFFIPYSVISFPRLKYLRLEGVELEYGFDHTMKLLSSPLLEELTIKHCYIWGNIQVCCPNLQVLKIWERDFYHCHRSAKICMVADSLKYFSYSGNLYNEFRICASSSTQLTEVELDVDDGELAYLNGLGLNFYVILKSLSGSRNLCLSDYFLEGLEKLPELLDTVPIFECVTRLDIRVYEEEISIDSLALMKIYERCPHLECLNIGKLCQTVRRSPQLSPIPSCFKTHLKKMMVHYYVPGDDAALSMCCLIVPLFWKN